MTAKRAGHSFEGFTEDDMGFIVVRCECGWISPPCPGRDEATDALMDHTLDYA